MIPWFGAGLLPLIVIYVLATRHRGGGEGLPLVYRLLVISMLIGFVGSLFPAIFRNADVLAHVAQSSPLTTSSQTKMSAAELAVQFARAQRIPASADFRCRPAEHGWDYVCSYMPTPSQSTTRVELAFIVDSKRWLKASGTVPEGATIPAPRSN